MAKVLEKFTDETVIIECEMLDGKPFVTIRHQNKVIGAMPPEELIHTKYDVRDYAHMILDKIYKGEE